MPKFPEHPTPDYNWTGEWDPEGLEAMPCIECGLASRYSVPGSGVWYCVGCWARKGLWEEAVGDVEAP